MSLVRTAGRTLLILAFSGPAMAQLGPQVAPPENPFTESKRILGKALFWDEQLSSDSTIACGTCHIPATGGADPRVGLNSRHPGPDGNFGTSDDKFGSLGTRLIDLLSDYAPEPIFAFDPQVTTRLATSHISAGHFDELFWDGRATSEFVDPETGAVSIASGGALESQALEPILSPVEMATEGRTWQEVRDKLESVTPLALAWNLNPDLTAALSGNTSYPDLFEAAFGDPAITAERIAFAIATYERTLNPDQTPFDSFAAGQQNALTPNQRDGLMAFNSPQARCAQCHSGPNFSDGSYRNLGLRPPMEDQGRRDVTGLFSDRGRFKVPSLRNVGLRERFFHNGSFLSLQTIMNFYNGDGGQFDNNKDPLMNGIIVPPQVAQSIVDFLTNGLTDPRVANELPPFDRPRLNSERPNPEPILLGGERAGSGGLVPQMLAVSQGALGDPTFRVGVHGALGGAPAALGWSTEAPGGGGPLPAASVVFPTNAVILNGNGMGAGYATWKRALPSVPAMSGMKLYAQWYVHDPAALGNTAKSELAEITLF